MKDVLKEIVAKKRERIALAKLVLPEEELRLKVQGLPAPRPFGAAISKRGVISLIAEIKKASPSAGLIRENFNPLEIASVYQEAGVQAISVLTEEDHFQGNLSYIADVRNVVSVPVLRKDFILEPYQVYESRYWQADAILLIAELVSKDTLAEMIRIATALGMDCLVEAHGEKDLKKALSLKANIIGINNRDLRTLEVDTKTTERLYPLIPKGRIVVVESGIKARQEVLFLKVLGVNACLIGQSFMESSDIKSKVEEIMGW